MRTEDVSQDDRRFWLNLLQLTNIHVILVTLETFHELFWEVVDSS